MLGSDKKVGNHELTQTDYSLIINKKLLVNSLTNLTNHILSFFLLCTLSECYNVSFHIRF